MSSVRSQNGQAGMNPQRLLATQRTVTTTSWLLQLKNQRSGYSLWQSENHNQITEL